MMRRYCRYIRLIVLTAAVFVPWGNSALAQPAQDDYKELYDNLISAFASNNDKTFFESLRKYKAYTLDHHLYDKYYNAYMNEVIYDINNNHLYRAMKTAETMREDANQHRQTKEYGRVSLALGLVYQSYGNDSAAKYMMRLALEQLRDDQETRANVFLDICVLIMDSDPKQALIFADSCLTLSSMDIVRCNATALKAIIAHEMGDSLLFWQYNDDFRMQRSLYKGSMGSDYEIHLDALTGLGKGNFANALKMTENFNNSIDRWKFATLIYRRMGDRNQTYNALKRMERAKDSVYCLRDLNEIKDINNDLLRKDQENKRIHHYALFTLTLVVLSLLAFLSLIYYSLRRRRCMLRLRKQQDELESARDKALESQRLKDSFILDIGNNIKEPLAAIANNVGAIIDSNSSSQKLNAAADKILKASQEITSVLNELLDISVLQSYGQLQKEDDVDIEELCQEAALNINIPYGKHLKLNMASLVPKGLIVRTNREHLLKAVGALLDNAYKFTDDGEVDLLSKLSVKYPGMIVISVSDTGPGVKAEDAKRIFQKYGKKSEKTGGLGIGLSIARAQIRKLGGDIILDREYNIGARFIVYVPQK